MERSEFLSNFSEQLSVLVPYEKVAQKNFSVLILNDPPAWALSRVPKTLNSTLKPQILNPQPYLTPNP
jgi:hypothetical protein